MKVYLSVPMIANRALPRARAMAKAIADSGNELTSPWVLGELGAVATSDLNIFRRDLAGAEECDLLVADVTEPSVGVGMEIMAAYKAGRRVLVLAKEGNPVSRMLLHMEGKDFLTYRDDGEVYQKVLTSLDQGGAKVE